MPLRAVFPGSFDPLTIAHVEMASAARAHTADDVGRDLRVDLAMSQDPLGKDRARQTPVDARRAHIEAATAHLEWVGVAVLEQRLIVEIAATYDRVILGADKWDQLFDPRFYADGRRPQDVVRALCPAIVFRRPGHRVAHLRSDDRLLDLPPDLRPISSSAARAGRHDWRYHGRG